MKMKNENEFEHGSIHVKIENDKTLIISDSELDEFDVYHWDENESWWDLSFMSSLSAVADEAVTAVWYDENFIEFLRYHGGNPD